MCDAAERADDRRQQVETHCHWLVRPELDWYDQQMRHEEQAGVRAAVAWVDSLSAAELEALQQVRLEDRERPRSARRTGRPRRPGPPSIVTAAPSAR